MPGDVSFTNTLLLGRNVLRPPRRLPDMESVTVVVNAPGDHVLDVVHFLERAPHRGARAAQRCFDRIKT